MLTTEHLNRINKLITTAQSEEFDDLKNVIDNEISRRLDHSISNSSITVNGKNFFTAQLHDEISSKSYDITVIFSENPDESVGQLDEFIGYYYGEPCDRLTLYYINEWYNNHSSI